MLTAVWFCLRAIQNFLAFVLRGFHKISVAAFVENTSTSVIAAIALTFIWINGMEAHVRDIVILMMFALVMVVLAATIFTIGLYTRTKPDCGMNISDAIKTGIPLGILAVTAVGANEAYIWIASAMTSPSDVAYYGASQRLAKLIQMPLLILNSVIASTIAQLASQDRSNEVERVLRISATLVFIPTVVIVTVILLAPGAILGIIFGATYENAAGILMLLSISYAISAAVGSPGIYMAMSGHQTSVMKISLISTAIGILISIISAPYVGVIGVALGASITRITQNILLWLYCYIVQGIKTNLTTNVHTFIKGY